ncbi:6-phosphogluconolactonase [Nocardioides sp. GY 10127]|uniref:6-phosphogluconolactonase n=1 Tax=Nocardioides sp. GY 10127 TaxID=2569762 RepID=UPI0010A80D13|nr:6-phosphogluconolactonase [Nocardioides sp. GY 10127]TIC86558.1 6-phosphogluconolactonase [Nocardioides sp. GY 10127]
MSPLPDRPAARVEVHPDASALATAIAGELLNRLADVQAAGRTPHVVLTGGTIADAMHAEVTRLADASGVDLTEVEFWFGDERFVAPDSPDRNVGQVRRAFLDPAGVPARRVHAMPSTQDAEDVDAAAALYADELAEQGPEAFDVAMFGVGPDGHIASLFPGFPQLAEESATVLGVRDAPKPPPERITLTYPALARSRAVWFLVSGEGKAESVAAAHAEGTTKEQIPAVGLMGTEDTRWFLDTGSASQL